MVKDAEHLYIEIKKTLTNFSGAARYAVMRNWRRMSMVERRNVVRALGIMADVAVNPATYFSRASTVDAWRRRTSKFSKMDNGNSPFNAGDTMCSPADIINTSVYAAFESNLELRETYSRFCNAVVDWEYDRTSMHARRQSQAYIHIDKVAKIMSESDTWRKSVSAIVRREISKEK